MISRCVCKDIAFCELLPVIREQRLKSVDDIADQTECGAICGLCRPYLKRMLETGQTRFAEPIRDRELSS